MLGQTGQSWASPHQGLTAHGDSGSKPEPSQQTQPAPRGRHQETLGDARTGNQPGSPGEVHSKANAVEVGGKAPASTWGPEAMLLH